MQPLIDGDVLRYELGYSGEYDEIDENTNEKIHHIREWEFVQELVDNKIKFISEEAGGTQPPLIFLTGSALSTRIINRSTASNIVLETPFREIVAVTKPYKGTRKGDKPFHFDNITAYLLANYDYRVSNGLEADDLMSIEQCRRDDTIICTRDKDLRMVPGWHYGWECGKQPSFGPELVDARGWLKLNHKKELKGVGLKFFFAQMLTGDTVDNIPGCKRVGDVGAMKLLEPCNTKREHELAVIGAYQNAYPDNWKDMIEEQSKLLWMVRELDDKGKPIFYEWKYE